MDFIYAAKNAAGHALTGTIDAPSEEQAIILLQQKELVVIGLRPASRRLLDADFLEWFRRPSHKDLVIFTRQLATLIDADVPLLEALGILERQTERDSFHRVIGTVIASVQGGATLSVALAEHEAVFSRFYTSMVRVGEVSGRLQETLIYLADYLERSANLAGKIKGAVFYPAFVLVSMVIVAAIMMTTVIPQLLTIVEDSGVTDLPLPTRMLIAVTHFVTSYAVVLAILTLAGVGTGLAYIRTPSGRRQWDALKIRLPRFGRVFQDFYVARVAEVLATLIRSGVPIIESVSITADVVGNAVYRATLLEAADRIKGGGTLSEVLARHDEFPTLVSSMVATGERTGRTDAMLESVLKFFKTEIEQAVQNLAQLVEPVLILILGLGIGILVAAILLPIYSLVNVI